VPGVDIVVTSFLLRIALAELAAWQPRRHRGGTLIPHPDFSIRRP